MPRKLTVAMAALCVCACTALPAAAKTHQKRTQTRPVLSTGKGWHRIHAVKAKVASVSAATPYVSFKCEVTVGVGTDGNTPKNYTVTDSSEQYFEYSTTPPLYSVTSNCIGTLPKGVVHASSIITHDVGCKQYNPLNKNAPTIQGYGISTTYPDGQYSETCNTPNFT
jgi:hypothetical protein